MLHFWIKSPLFFYSKFKNSSYTFSKKKLNFFLTQQVEPSRHSSRFFWWIFFTIYDFQHFYKITIFFHSNIQNYETFIDDKKFLKSDLSLNRIYLDTLNDCIVISLSIYPYDFFTWFLSIEIIRDHLKLCRLNLSYFVCK